MNSPFYFMHFLRLANYTIKLVKNVVFLLLIFYSNHRKVSLVSFLEKPHEYSSEADTMNCWKTINYTKEYGSQRIFILSSITMIITFIFLYVPASYYFVQSSFYDNYFFVFIACFWLIYPVHKLLHFLPVAHLGKKVQKKVSFRLGIPLIHVRVTEPISKAVFIVALLAPFVIISGVLLAACWHFPHYVHYITMLLAYHAGLCFSDMLCLKNICTAPQQAYIEENEEGIEILVYRAH